MEQPTRPSISSRVFPPVLLWVVNRVLATPAVKERTRKLDARAHKKRLKAAKALSKVGRNALSHPGWLAAGVTAVAVGVGLITKAAVTK